MDFSFIEDEGQRAKAVEAYNTSIDAVKTEVKDTLTTDFNKQVEGLKGKNSQLLDEKKKIQESLKNFDGLDAEAAKAALELINGNEEIKLIQEGKFEEVIDKRVSGIKGEHEEIVTTITNERDTEAEGHRTYKKKFESKMVDDSIREAALNAKVRSEAIEDILNKGRMMFLLGEDGLSVEAREGLKLDGKLLRTEDDKVLTTALWVDELKSKSPHYWPSSTSGNYNEDFTNMEEIDIQIANAAKAGDNKLYRALRDKKKKMTGR